MAKAKKKVYDRDGVRFEFPDHWTLDHVEETERGPSVAVYSPGGSFWMVTVLDAGGDPQALADESLAAMKEEYDDLDAEPMQEKVGPFQAVGYDLNFVLLDLTCTSLIRCISTDDHVFLVLCESEDREFADLEPTFRAITASLLKNA